MAFPVLSICREFSAERINRVVNHPEVRPWVGGSGPIDLSSLIANPANVLLMGEGGGFIFTQQEPGVYEVHSQFLPEHRGPNVLSAAADAARFMFTRTDCEEILSKVPDGNVAAAAFAKAMKWEFRFSRPNAWQTDHGLVGVKYYGKTLMQWASQSDQLAVTGEWFHGKLEAAKLEKGALAPVHDDDDAHDRYVGAACEMIMADQIVKGINFYNRWARFSGYATISVIAANPYVLDIGDAILAVRGDNFEVLLCR